MQPVRMTIELQRPRRVFCPVPPVKVFVASRGALVARSQRALGIAAKGGA